MTERVKRKPYSVILLDEIEKAHPDILNILLQVFDDGMITDAYGDVVDFKNCIIIMTSNLGSVEISKGGKLGFESGAVDEGQRSRRELVMGAVKRSLSPEFINRIDEIIVFDALTEDDLLQIARLMIAQLNDRLSDKGFRLAPTDEAYQWLVRTTCHDRSFGARPLRRAIQRHIEDALSETLIKGEFPERGEVEVYLEDDRLGFRAAFELAR